MTRLSEAQMLLDRLKPYPAAPSEDTRADLATISAAVKLLLEAEIDRMLGRNTY